MSKIKRTNIYIDGANLHRAALELGFNINYKKFRGWLRQKYSPENVFIFLGLIPKKAKLYEHLQRCGFVVVFKQTVSIGGEVKGNCDAELVLKATSHWYEKDFEKCLLITGDGDFGCLIEFLQEKNALHSVVAPNKKKCSILLRNKNCHITFLNDVYHKFADKV